MKGKEKSNAMTKEEVIKQLNLLIEDRKAFCAGDYDPIFDKDIEALKYAIKKLEKTALEVPVQEQFRSSNLKANIKSNGLDMLKNISTDSSLKLDTICTDKTSVEINLSKS